MGAYTEGVWTEISALVKYVDGHLKGERQKAGETGKSQACQQPNCFSKFIFIFLSRLAYPVNLCACKGRWVRVREVVLIILFKFVQPTPFSLEYILVFNLLQKALQLKISELGFQYFTY